MIMAELGVAYVFFHPTDQKDLYSQGELRRRAADWARACMDGSAGQAWACCAPSPTLADYAPTLVAPA